MPGNCTEHISNTTENEILNKYIIMVFGTLALRDVENDTHYIKDEEPQNFLHIAVV